MEVVTGHPQPWSECRTDIRTERPTQLSLGSESDWQAIWCYSKYLCISLSPSSRGKPATGLRIGHEPGSGLRLPLMNAQLESAAEHCRFHELRCRFPITPRPTPQFCSRSGPRKPVSPAKRIQYLGYHDGTSRSTAGTAAPDDGIHVTGRKRERRPGRSPCVRVAVTVTRECPRWPGGC